MSAPKGNKNGSRAWYTTTRDEPLREKITIRVTSSMLEELKKQDDMTEFIRQAIEDKLKHQNMKNS
jgi:hypothetical protein